MTEKLYEQDAFLRDFEGAVLSCAQGKKGYDIVLDRTAFYPEGGGQPWDTGTLGGVEVLEVHSRDGEIVHTCGGPLEAGQTVSGSIHWERRFDLMQQHSGEHILSGLAHARWGCDNVGFHMGAELTTVDFNVELTQEDLVWLEGEANRYIWENHPIQITYPTREELSHITYRSKKEIDGQVRLVAFPGADWCACCGTHVNASGQVGLIKLLSVQKFRDGARIELVCGGRAARYVNHILAQNTQVSRLLSAKAFETGAAVERLLAESEALKSQVMSLEDRRFAALAEERAGAGDVLLFEDGLSPDGLRRLCDAILHTCGGRCACFSGTDGQGYKYAVGLLEGDLREFNRSMTQALNGRGGGKPNFVQGSVQASRAEIEEFFS